MKVAQEDEIFGSDTDILSIEELCESDDPISIIYNIDNSQREFPPAPPEIHVSFQLREGEYMITANNRALVSFDTNPWRALAELIQYCKPTYHYDRYTYTVGYTSNDEICGISIYRNDDRIFSLDTESEPDSITSRQEFSLEFWEGVVKTRSAASDFVEQIRPPITGPETIRFACSTSLPSAENEILVHLGKYLMGLYKANHLDSKEPNVHQFLGRACAVTNHSMGPGGGLVVHDGIGSGKNYII